MARIIYTEHALNDLDRLVDFLLEDDPIAALETTDLIIEAIKILANHPLIGRKVEYELRELVVSRGKTGYLALYSYEPRWDKVLVLSVRHQREVGMELDDFTY